MIPSLKHTVGFIYAHDGSEYKPLGTGFFAWIREDTKTFIYLITCKHVVYDDIDIHPLYVRLNRSDKHDVHYVPLENEWFYHGDKSIDLAVTTFNPPQDEPCDFEPVNIDTVFVPDEHVGELTEGYSVAFIGLFRKIPGTLRNTPIYRYGHIAMLPDDKLSGKYGDSDYIVVECVAFKGNSGAPLWVSITFRDEEQGQINYVFILGVMTQVYIEEEIASSFNLQNRTIYNSGVSLAIPITYVRDILLGDELVADRKSKVKESIQDDDKPIPISSDIISPDDDPFTRQDFMLTLQKASRQKEDPPHKEKS